MEDPEKKIDMQRMADEINENHDKSLHKKVNHLDKVR